MINRRARRTAYRRERHDARRAFAAGETATGWLHLERAHVLAQPLAVAHTGSHLAMLRRALAERDTREALGQIVRAALAGPASLAGRIPTGNDGRARTPLTRQMPIPDDIVDLVESCP